MNKYLIRLLVIIWAISSSGNLIADDYQKYSQDIRKTVWRWDIDAFKNFIYPEKFKDKSEIVLARHQQIEATNKKRLRITGYGMGYNSQLYCTNIDRRMIKLNDKKALDKYSELSFVRQSKSAGVFGSNKIRIVAGARIIKPNGIIQEIDIDGDAVTVTEGKKDAESYNKIAIKGLQIGDILDYFFSEETDFENLNIDPLSLTFFSEHPTLHSSVECILGPNLTVEYRTFNGAPDFEHSTDKDGNNILKVSQKDLKVIEDSNNTSWLSIYRDLPLIRLVILNNSSSIIPKSANARKGGIYKNISPEEILKDAKSDFAKWAGKMFWMGDIYKKVNNAILNYKLKNTTISNADLALFIQDALSFYWSTNLNNYPKEKFLIALEKLLKENNIESKICFTTNKYGPRKEEIIEKK